MHLVAALALLHVQATSVGDAFLAEMRAAVGGGVRSKIQKLFVRGSDSRYLFDMAEDRGGMRAVKVSMIPPPPGWEDTGKFWAVFHTYQEIENYHDPVYAVIQTGDGLRLGHEIVENEPCGYRIEETDADVHLFPSDNRVTVKVWLDLAKSGVQKAPIFRLADHYTVSAGSIAEAKSARVINADSSAKVLHPAIGDVVRAGSLLIPWTKSVQPRVTFDYAAVLPPGREEQVGPRVAYLTAWWIPSIARLPHKSNVRIVGPQDWVLQSEGVPADASQAKGFGAVKPAPGEQAVAWRCELPISYPKVVAGAYKVAAEMKVGSKTVRSYQLDPIDADRGARQCRLMADALDWYEKNLAPWPFDGYACFDGLGYYGIESYSYTLLAPSIINWAVSHEMGHTFFGGVVPCAYVRDAWNEGMTQYIDSIRYRNNSDGSLQKGLATVAIRVPMSQLPIAWAFNNATYYRGAYVMKMLEAEIGADKVQDALKAIIKDRIGKDTAWTDLRPYFEKAAGAPLGWFWSQWIEGAEFPQIAVTDANRVVRDGKYRTWVTVRQSGTEKPFRLKFVVKVMHRTDTAEQVVTLTGSQGMFSVDSTFAPTEATVEVFPYALASKGAAVAVRE